MAGSYGDKKVIEKAKNYGKILKRIKLKLI